MVLWEKFPMPGPLRTAHRKKRCVVVTFNSLLTEELPKAKWFEELLEKELLKMPGVELYDQFYLGSLPAVREMHTGRPSFLHSDAGPLEPFDMSMPELLSDQQVPVLSHLVTDHSWRLEDGGVTYFQRYTTFQVSGQQWGSNVDEPREDQMQPKRQELPELVEEFIDINRNADKWYLHIVSSDPGTRSKKHDESAVEASHERLLRCVLDCFSKGEGLWDDTMLIVNFDQWDIQTDQQDTRTDRGARMGPSKLCIYNPMRKSMKPRKHISDLATTVDIPVTIFHYFHNSRPPNMKGFVLGIDTGIYRRKSVIFGAFGEQVHIVVDPAHPALCKEFVALSNVHTTNGKYIYDRAPVSGNKPLYMFTLWPRDFDKYEVNHKEVELRGDMPFSQHCPVLQIPCTMNNVEEETRLCKEEEGRRKIPDAKVVGDLEALMVKQLFAELKRIDYVPNEQYERLGIPTKAKDDYFPYCKLANSRHPANEPTRTARASPSTAWQKSRKLSQEGPHWIHEHMNTKSTNHPAPGRVQVVLKPTNPQPKTQQAMLGNPSPNSRSPIAASADSNNRRPPAELWPAPTKPANSQNMKQQPVATAQPEQKHETCKQCGDQRPGEKSCDHQGKEKWLCFDCWKKEWSSRDSWDSYIVAYYSAKLLEVNNPSTSSSKRKCLNCKKYKLQQHCTLSQEREWCCISCFAEDWEQELKSQTRRPWKMDCFKGKTVELKKLVKYLGMNTTL